MKKDQLLASIPSGLRTPLIEEFNGLSLAYSQGRWKLTALDAGRFCEVVYTVLHGAITGGFAAAPAKPSNFIGACRALESMPPIALGDRSLRLLIPRLLPVLYEVRNNRNVGHVGGDVVSNKMDATLAREAAGWIVAELVRVFHGVSTLEAQEAVDALVERRHPLVWEVDGIKRVLAPSMTAAQRALILLYSTPGWVDISVLKSWVRYNGDFTKRVLMTLFNDGLIEIRGKETTISPAGLLRVETVLSDGG